MRRTRLLKFAGLTAAVALAGCAGNQSTNLTTASVGKPAPTKVALDPTCVRLASQINALRQEGTPARVHKVATGKTKTAVVKRASLAKVAELDRMNAQFQARCSKYPGLQTAAATPAATATQARPIAQPARTTTPQANQPIVAVPAR